MPSALQTAIAKATGLSRKTSGAAKKTTKNARAGFRRKSNGGKGG